MSSVKDFWLSKLISSRCLDDVMISVMKIKLSKTPKFNLMLISNLEMFKL